MGDFDPYKARPASANPLVVKCPHCKAGPCQPCTARGGSARRPLTQSRAHPSRYDALELFNRNQERNT